MTYLIIAVSVSSGFVGSSLARALSLFAVVLALCVLVDCLRRHTTHLTKLQLVMEASVETPKIPFFQRVPLHVMREQLACCGVAW